MIKKLYESVKNQRYSRIDHHQTAVKSFYPVGKQSGSARRNALVAYIIDPFLLANDDKIPNSHTHFQESKLIVQVFLELGYSVDVISYLNHTFQPKKKYDYFFSARTNFETISKRLNNDCIKIAHLDTAHWLFNNKAAYERYYALQQRRGVTLPLRRKIVEFNWAIEHADYATILGNQFTLDTYKYANKQIFRLPIPTCTVYPWFSNKDFKYARNNYLWFGSIGFVNKGLDLVLEAFTDMPEYHLYVCGPIEKEIDFVNAYKKELYETANIHTVGWVDIESPLFKDLCNKCVGMIYTSCSEGGGGCVITCMQAGLIPIVNYESSIDIDPKYGVLLPEATIGEIKKSIVKVGELSEDTLYAMARNAWEVSRERYTSVAYINTLKNIIAKISDENSVKNDSGENLKW